MNRDRLQGSVKRVFKGYRVGFYNVGALIIGIGFGGPLDYTYRDPQNSIGKFFEASILSTVEGLGV